MKLRLEQLKGQLRKSLAPVYLIHGEELLLQQEAADTIRAHARQQGFSERDVLTVESGFDWGQLYSATQALSLFGDRKLLELRLGSQKPGDAGSKALIQYCQSPNPDTLLLILVDKLDSAQQRSKWFQAIDQRGVTLPIWKIEGNRLPQWLRQRLQREQLSIDEEALALLCSLVEGNLLAAAQEVEKLKLYAKPGQQLSATLIDEVVSNSARFNRFALADIALQGDAAQALRTLYGLRDEGVEPLALLWGLHRDLRTLRQLQQASQIGERPATIFQRDKVFERRQGLLQQAARRLAPPLIDQALRFALDCDQQVKGAKEGDPWQSLTQLIVLLCGLSLTPTLC